MSVQTPAGVHIGTWPSGSSEWLAARENGIGGSEISAILGLSPFDSPYSLWCKRRGLIPPTEVTPSMEWGNYAEPALLAWYNDKYEPITAQPGTYRNQDRPWMIANPDGLTGGKIVEAKTAYVGFEWGPAGTGDVPPYYRCQAGWYEDVLGIDECDIIASVAGAPPEVWTVRYDPEDAAYMRDAAKDFLDSIDTGTEPEIDGRDHTYKAIRQLNPNIEPGAEWYVDDETADAFLRACRDVKTSEAAKRKAASVILRQMGNAQYAVLGKKRIASRQVRGEGSPYLVASREAA